MTANEYMQNFVAFSKMFELMKINYPVKVVSPFSTEDSLFFIGLKTCDWLIKIFIIRIYINSLLFAAC